MVIIMIYYIT